MKLASYAFAMMVMALISSCDNRPKVTSEQAPFGVGGIYPGISKDVLQNDHKLLPCEPDRNDKARCFVDQSGKNYAFFGASVSLIEVKLPAPYTRVGEVHFSTQGQLASKEAVERAWELKGKCLDYIDVTNARDFDKENNAFFLKTLSDFDLLPKAHGDFICTGQHFYAVLRYSASAAKSEARVDIFHPIGAIAMSLEHLYDSVEKYSRAKDEINTKLNARPANAPSAGGATQPTPAAAAASTTPKSRHMECAKYEGPDSAVQRNLDELAKTAGYGTGVSDGYFESLVQGLCRDDKAKYESLVSFGRISKRDAESIARNLGIQVELPEPTSQARLYQETRAALQSLSIAAPVRTTRRGAIRETRTPRVGGWFPWH